MSDRHPLTLLPAALREAGYEGVTYRRAYTRALDGTLPVTRGTNGRWTFTPEDLPAIADALGLTDAHAA